MTEEEKKKMGRPIAGKQPRNKQIVIRLTENEKKALEAEATRTGRTMTQVITEFIKTLK
jgi:hypothetical protein